MSNRTLYSAVAGVALSLTTAISAQVAPLDRYGDDNPYNRVEPSTINPERGGTLKPADPRPTPGTIPNGPRTSRDVRAYERARESSYRPDYRPADTSNYDRASLASDRQAPMETRSVNPVPGDTSSQRAVDNNMTEQGVDYRFIKPADPAVLEPDVKFNGGVDRTLAEDRNLGSLTNQDSVVVAPNLKVGDMSTTPIDSQTDPRFRQPVLEQPEAQLANDRQSPATQPSINEEREMVTPPAIEPVPVPQGQGWEKNIPAPSKGERAPGAILNERNPLPVENPTREVTPNTINPNQVNTASGGNPDPMAVPHAGNVTMQELQSSSGSSANMNSTGTVTEPQNTGPNGQVQSPQAEPAAPRQGNDINRSLNNETQKPLSTEPKSGEIQSNAADLDLPAIRKTLSDFVEKTVGMGGVASAEEHFIRSDRTRIATGAGTDELDRQVAQFRTNWREKYNSDIGSSNSAMALADGFRIITPSDEAQLAGQRQGPSVYNRSDAVKPGDQSAQRTDLQKTDGAGKRQDQSSAVNPNESSTGNQVNDRDPANKDRPNTSNQPNRRDVVDENSAPGRAEARSKSQMLAGETDALVIIPIAAICVDHGAHVNGKDVNKADVTRNAGKALDKSGEQVNKVGENGNRVGDALQDKGDELKDRAGKMSEENKHDGHKGKFNTIADRQLRLTREDNNWRIDLPDTVNGDEFRAELARNLKALNSMKDQWPADQTEGYRMVAAHVLAAAGTDR